MTGTLGIVMWLMMGAMLTGFDLRSPGDVAALGSSPRRITAKPQNDE
jgi:hypothetical protein